MRIHYLRNRKHFPCLYRVPETRVEVWEKDFCILTPRTNLVIHNCPTSQRWQRVRLGRAYLDDREQQTEQHYEFQKTSQNSFLFYFLSLSSLGESCAFEKFAALFFVDLSCLWNKNKVGNGTSVNNDNENLFILHKYQYTFSNAHYNNDTLKSLYS